MEFLINKVYDWIADKKYNRFIFNVRQERLSSLPTYVFPTNKVKQLFGEDKEDIGYLSLEISPRESIHYIDEISTKNGFNIEEVILSLYGDIEIHLAYVYKIIKLTNDIADYIDCDESTKKRLLEQFKGQEALISGLYSYHTPRTEYPCDDKYKRDFSYLSLSFSQEFRSEIDNFISFELYKILDSYIECDINFNEMLGLVNYVKATLKTLSNKKLSSISESLFGGFGTDFNYISSEKDLEKLVQWKKEILEEDNYFISKCPLKKCAIYGYFDGAFMMTRAQAINAIYNDVIGDKYLNKDFKDPKAFMNDEIKDIYIKLLMLLYENDIDMIERVITCHKTKKVK